MQCTIASDEQLLTRLSCGDESAFQALYDRYWEVLYTYTVRKVEFQETAEEIVQDIFIDLWRRREGLLIDRLEPYLFGAAKNRIIDVIRSSMVRRYHEQTAQVITYSNRVQLDVEEALAYNDLYDAIVEGMTILPEKTSEIFRLNRLDGLSAPEIAARLAIPLRTVEYHIAQALRAMRVYLQDFLILLVFISNAW